MIDKLLKDKNKIYILAEIGINHDGDINKAKDLINASKEAGADGVKFQLIHPEKLIIEKINQNGKLIKNPVIDIFKRYELRDNDYIKLYEHAKKIDIDFLCTVFDYEALDFIDNYVPVHKIASGDLTHIPLIEKVSLKNKPIILSTGMADLSIIKNAINAIENKNNNEIILLHCVSCYPPNDNEVNLNAIISLKQQFNKITGFSDHTTGSTAPIAACAMGARFIEKHVTFRRSDEGADHAMSMEMNEFSALIKELRSLEKMFGSMDKKSNQRELEISKSAHRGVYTNKKILKGQVINEEDVLIVRPKTVLPPFESKNIVGKIAKRDIDEFSAFTSGDY